jgi:predicted nucleic acid-binding protein
MSEKKLTKIGTIGADTTFLIDFFKGEKKAVEFMKLNSHLIRVSELVIYEFLCGKLGQREKRLFLEAIEHFGCIPFNHDAALLASEIFRNQKKTGKTIGHQDCMIAGSYLSHGVFNIVTRNKKHFEKITKINAKTY